MSTTKVEECVVGITAPGNKSLKALVVRIKGEDVYVNYSDSSTASAHSSYHSSGQHHIKVGNQYIQWTGGPTGQWEPMKLFRVPPRLAVDTREEFFPIGWEVSKLQSILPARNSQADFIVDARNLDANSILGLAVSLIGGKVQKRTDISGYGIFDSYRFGTSVIVEIEAFTVA